MRKILAIGVGLSLLISLLFLIIDYSATQITFYQTQYQALNVAETIGIDDASLMRVTEKLLDYLRADVDNLDIQVEIDGQATAMFNRREIDHMVDVQDLYVLMLNLAYGSLIFAVVGSLVLYGQTKTMFFKWLWMGYRQAAYVLGAFILSIGVYVALDFRGFWIQFHHVFFTNDLWLLNPLTDRLIMMVPEAFFFNIVLMILIRVFIGLTLLTFIIMGLKKGFNRRLLKWLALFVMSVDHLGYFIFPEYIEFRVIGRLAFPLFAFLFAQTLQTTQNPDKLKVLLWSSALITQVMFWLSGIEIINIFFLFAISLHVIDALKARQYLLIIALAIATEVAGVDYGVYGLISILWFYQVSHHSWHQAAGFIGFTIVFNFLRILPGYGFELIFESLRFSEFSTWGYRLWLQVASGFAFLLIPFYDVKKPESWGNVQLDQIERYVFYVYYPTHMVIMAWIGSLL